MVSWHEPELYATMSLAIDSAVQRAVSEGTQSKSTKLSIREIGERVNAKRKAHEEEGRAFFSSSDLYVYQDLKNSVLDEASKFADSPAAETHIKALNHALELTLGGATNTLIETLTKARPTTLLPAVNTAPNAESSPTVNAAPQPF